MRSVLFDRVTRSRSAPPSAAAAASSSAATTNAHPPLRASRASRTATALVSGGAPSSTTNANAPERRSSSAHHAARAELLLRAGRIIQSGGETPAPPPSSARAARAQSRGASVRAASTYATQSPRAIVARTTCRSSVVLPAPRAPSSSVSRPHGMPPRVSAASNAATPVASARTSACGASVTADNRWRSAASDAGRSALDTRSTRTTAAAVIGRTRAADRAPAAPRPPAHPRRARSR